MISKTFEVDVWKSPYTDELGHIYSGYELPVIYLKEKNLDMTDMGYVRIGTGTLTCNLIDPKDTVAEQVKSLESQIQKTEADAQLTITRLRGQINNLLAICHDDTPEWEPDSIEREEGL